MLRFCLALLVAAPASAVDLAAAFGERPMASDVRLSPDGTKVSYLTPTRTGGGTAVVVADLKTGKIEAVSINTKSLRATSCRLKTETRLICALRGNNVVTGYTLGYERIIAIDTDGGRAEMIGNGCPSCQDAGRIIDWLPDDPASVLMQMGANAYRVSIADGKRVYMGNGDAMTGSLRSDNRGRIRLKSSSGTPAFASRLGSYYWYARTVNSRDWRKVLSVDLDAHTQSEMLGFDEAGENVLALMPRLGRLALVAVPVAGAADPKLIFAHPQVDVDDVLRIGKYDRPVAARYTTDTTAYDYFDPALARLGKALTKALPGAPTVDILDESWDGSKKLVYASSDTNPGHYYLYDTATRSLGTIATVRPALEGMALAQVEAVTHPARDGTPIPAYITWPPGKPRTALRAIVLPHGGPAARDSRGFDWLAQYFAAQGYVVLQPNFRGSSGYGEAWFKDNGFKSWPTAIGDINDGARWLSAQGIAMSGSLAIVGWSYGGYAALQANVVEPELYRAVVAVAPVTDLVLLRQKAQAFTSAPFVSKMLGTGHHLAAGSPARHAAKIKAPVLLFSGDRDINVDIGQSRAMAAALREAGRKHELIVYPGLDHQLDESVARTDLLRRSGALLATAFGG